MPVSPSPPLPSLPRRQCGGRVRPSRQHSLGWHPPALSTQGLAGSGRGHRSPGSMSGASVLSALPGGARARRGSTHPTPHSCSSWAGAASPAGQLGWPGESEGLSAAPLHLRGGPVRAAGAAWHWGSRVRLTWHSPRRPRPLLPPRARRAGHRECGCCSNEKSEQLNRKIRIKKLEFNTHAPHLLKH